MPKRRLQVVIISTQSPPTPELAGTHIQKPILSRILILPVLYRTGDALVPNVNAYIIFRVPFEGQAPVQRK